MTWRSSWQPWPSRIRKHNLWRWINMRHKLSSGQEKCHCLSTHFWTRVIGLAGVYHEVLFHFCYREYWRGNWGGEIGCPVAFKQITHQTPNPVSWRQFPRLFLPRRITLLLAWTYDTTILSAWIYETEQSHVFPSLSRVLKGIQRTEVCWILLLSLNLWIQRLKGITEYACLWNHNNSVLQRVFFRY
jgi:hypothetical protein